MLCRTVCVCIVLHHLMTRIRSEKCVGRRFRPCASVPECTSTHPDGVAHAVTARAVLLCDRQRSRLFTPASPQTHEQCATWFMMVTMSPGNRKFSAPL